MIEFEELVYQEAERRKMTIPAERLNKADAAYRQALSQVRTSFSSISRSK